MATWSRRLGIADPRGRRRRADPRRDTAGCFQFASVWYTTSRNAAPQGRSVDGPAPPARPQGGSMRHDPSYRRRRLATSHWPADGSRPLLDWTLGDALRHAAAEVPDRTALVEARADRADGRRWTYAELLAASERVAAALLTRFRPGEHVAFWAANTPEWQLAFYGCALAGIVLVTVNPAY